MERFFAALEYSRVIGDTIPAISHQIIETIANQPDIIEQVLDMFGNPMVYGPLAFMLLIAVVLLHRPRATKSAHSTAKTPED